MDARPDFRNAIRVLMHRALEHRYCGSARSRLGLRFQSGEESDLNGCPASVRPKRWPDVCDWVLASQPRDGGGQPA